MSLAVASGNCLTVGYVMSAQPLLYQEDQSAAPLIVAVMFGHEQLVRILLDLYKPNDPIPCTGTVFLIIILLCNNTAILTTPFSRKKFSD